MVRIPKLREAELLLHCLGGAGVVVGPRWVAIPRDTSLPLHEDAVLFVQPLVIAVHRSQSTHLRVV